MKNDEKPQTVERLDAFVAAVVDVIELELVALLLDELFDVATTLLALDWLTFEVLLEVLFELLAALATFEVLVVASGVATVLTGVDGPSPSPSPDAVVVLLVDAVVVTAEKPTSFGAAWMRNNEAVPSLPRNETRESVTGSVARTFWFVGLVALMVNDVPAEFSET